METKSNQIIGNALLVLGLLVIFIGIYSLYNVFAAKKEAPQVFKYNSEESVDVDAQNNNDIREETVIDKSRLTDPAYVKSIESQQKDATEELIKNQIGNLFKDIIPQEFIIKFLNLSSWSIFIFILIFAGGKISGLGIKLLKN
ncbi:MAG: hypothetical protein KAI67_04855 [Candidatus Pacebacteria bacterium]|nr:hypothetical protein [Candidatus Paceibacterota bacterium]